MSDFQEIFNQTNIISSKRDARPFINEEDKTCPFCLNNEDCLETIIDESWLGEELCLRVVPNRYPALSEEGTKGVHDVMIDTKYHTKHPKDFSIQHWQKLLLGIQKRWQTLMNRMDIAFIQVFKNYGRMAGASISHSHWQLIALEEIPYSMKQMYRAFGQKETCYLCHVQHLEEGFRVWEDELIEIWVPSIPQFPYEVWLIPKRHCQHYGELSQEEIENLGRHLKYLLEVYHQLSPKGDFNICMMSGDIKGEYPYHFYIKLVMRTGQLAGFEIATKCHILSVEPMAYAKEMNKILKGIYK